MLAHIRDGQIIQTYTSEKGWMTLANGDRVSPVIEGYANGADKVVPVVEETVDNSTTAHTTRAVETIVEANRVIRRTTISDTPIETLRERAEMDRFDFAGAAAAAGFITYAEAADWAAGNSVPAAVQTIIGGLPAEQQGPTTLDVLARPTIRRNAALMPALMVAFQTDDAGVDALYGLV